MGLFDFVEKNDGIGTATNSFGQLSAVVVADIAGGRADKTRDVVFFAKFGHVDFY